MSTRQPAVPSGFATDIPIAPAAAGFSPPSRGGFPIGGIVFFAGGSYPYDNDPLESPLRWLGCSGQEVLISIYPALAALLGNTWGVSSNPATLFKMPDLRGRFPLVPSGGFPAATTGGASTHVLTIGEMPAHDHPPGGAEDTFWTRDAAAGNVIQTGASFQANNLARATTGPAGGGGAHNNMPPYIAINAYMRAVP